MTDNHSGYLGQQSIRCNVRILLLHPTPPPEENEGPLRVPAKTYLLPSTEVDEVYCLGAPTSYEGPNWKDAAERVKPKVVAKVQWAAANGYAAIVVNCMKDPGVAAAKKVAAVPVIGIGEACRSVASLFGEKPASIFPEEIGVLDLAADEDKTYAELLAAGQWNIAKRGVDVLIPNCAFIGGLADRLQSELGVPVLPNTDIGLKMAELIATLNVIPEQPWVAGKRASKRVQWLSRTAQRLQRWIPLR